MRNGMSTSDAGKLGAKKTLLIKALKKELKIIEYNKNPKICKFCGNPISFEKRNNKFCCASHAISYTNSHRIIKKQNKDVQKNIKDDLKYKSRKKKCPICGCIKGSCIDTYVCKKYRIFNSLQIFGFDYSLKGTTAIIDEFYRVRNIILNFYLLYGSNILELLKLFNYKSGPANFHKILKSLNINTRNLSDALKFAIEHNRRDAIPMGIHYKFHDEYHTTWDNKEVYLRSSYETDFANELDKNKILYEVETLKIRYFDSLLNKERLAIPDFYLPDDNLIVEVKSLFTLDVLNMKDKFNAYKALNYKIKLILEHKEVDINTL